VGAPPSAGRVLVKRPNKCEIATMSNEGTWRRLTNKDGTPGKWELRVQRFVGDDDRKLSFFGETKHEANESLARWETLQQEKWAAKRQGYNRDRKLAILDILEAGHPAKPFMDATRAYSELVLAQTDSEVLHHYAPEARAFVLSQLIEPLIVRLETLKVALT
jgi:hypothetical protein